VSVSAPSANWAAGGTALFLRALDDLGDHELDAPSTLPGWTRRHLVAHVASNAEGIGRLVSWARTGQATPMYASPRQRTDDIASGALRSARQLRTWAHGSAAELAGAFSAMPDSAWRAHVVTAQRRTVPATELPWLRAREVLVHSVDLDTGITFADLPAAFVHALISDVTVRRSEHGDGPSLSLEARDTAATWQVTGRGEAVHVSLPAPELVGWLTGRMTRPELPVLRRWL
jgi:maleylpyruvate isomerase